MTDSEDFWCKWPINRINPWEKGTWRLEHCYRDAEKGDLLGFDLCWQHKSLLMKRIELAVWNDRGVQHVVRTVLREADAAATAAAKAEAERRRRDRSVVYFLERDGFIKIGFTARLSTRLSAIRKGGSMPAGMTVGPVEILATMPGGKDNEAYLHRRFAEHRLPGSEWFYPAPELMHFICGLKGYRRNT